MKEIKLTQGKVALIDDEDFEWLSKSRWQIAKRNNQFYAISSRWDNKNRKIYKVLMHREIMKDSLNDRQEIDHINYNGLDNRKINLRACTKSQNLHHRSMQLSLVLI